MSETVFITTQIAHRNCKKCADSADSARITARVTGSVGATHSNGEHSATVRRADQMHTGPSPEVVKEAVAKLQKEFDNPEYQKRLGEFMSEGLPDMDDSGLRDSKTKQYRELASTISNQAKAIAEGNLTGPVHGAVALLRSNVEMLAAWTEDDR